MKYNTIEVKSEMLNAGFSIYLLEIERENSEKLFYIGMTGDNYYPRARGAFYRIAGHLESNSKSTQNQLHKALTMRGIVNKKTGVFKKDLKIKMHHFAIEGFNPWSYTKILNKKFMQRLKNREDKNYGEYEDYKKGYLKIRELESALIFTFSNDERLINKDIKKDATCEHNDYDEITKKIGSIMKID